MGPLFLCVDAEYLENYVALMRNAAVLEQVETLPRAKRHAASDDRNGERRMCQGRANVGCHVIRPFERMTVMDGVFGDQAFEEIAQVERHIGIGILLNDEGAGGVLNKNGEGSVERRLLAEPVIDDAGKGIEAFAFGGQD